jgi:hypothetical protein
VLSIEDKTPGQEYLQTTIDLNGKWYILFLKGTMNSKTM